MATQVGEVASVLFGDVAFQEGRRKRNTLLMKTEYSTFMNAVFAQYWQRGRKAVARDAKRMADLKVDVTNAWKGKYNNEAHGRILIKNRYIRGERNPIEGSHQEMGEERRVADADNDAV